MTKAAMKPRARAMNWLRGHWPDRNPLRRASDRAETAVLATLAALFLAAAPVAAAFVGGLAAGHPAEQARHQVTATLLAGVPGPATGGLALPAGSLGHARWITPSGAARTGWVAAKPGAKAGSTVLVWISRSGRIVAPPYGTGQEEPEAAATAVLAVAAIVLGGWQLARWALDRRRFRAWDAEWQIIGPRWSPRR